jgi:flavin-binding protein dodecin
MREYRTNEMDRERERERERDRDYDRNGGRMSARRREHGRTMAEEADAAPIVKVIEVLAQSPYSWEDAARRAVTEASRTIRDIRSIYIKDMQAIVDDDHIVSYRINAKLSFAIDDRPRSEGQHARDS